MPVLASEQNIFPLSLLSQESTADDPSRWWAVHTKPRQEKSLARQLLGMQVPFYLPLVSQRAVVAGRRMTAELPLFASYLFIRATDEERVQALSTNRVVQMLKVPGTEAMTIDLRNVQIAIEAGEPLTTESRLTAGRRVRVKSGALMGVEGTIVSRRGQDRLLVAVSFLQQGVSILIDDFLVEPL